MKFTSDFGALTSGVSQQVGPYAQPGFLRECRNFVPSLTQGLHRRAGQQRVSASKAPISLGQIVKTVRASSTDGTLLLPQAGEPTVLRDDGVFLPAEYDEADPLVALLLENGAACATRLGPWLMIVPNGTSPELSYETEYGGEAVEKQQVAYLWVRSGVFDTEYTATVKTMTGSVRASYRTPKATYQELLSVEDIPTFTKTYPEASITAQENVFESEPGKYRLVYAGFTKEEAPTVEVPSGSSRLSFVLTATPQGSRGLYWLASDPNYIYFTPGAALTGVTVRYSAWAVTANPAYQTLVNLRTAQYNEESLAYQEQAIAQSTAKYVTDQLFSQLQGHALPVVRVSDTVIAINGSPLSELPTAVSSDDSELLVACSFVTDSVDTLPPYAIDGSIVAVQPTDSSGRFYMVADVQETGKAVWAEGGVRARGIKWNCVFARSGYGKLYLAGSWAYWEGVQSYWPWPSHTQPCVGDTGTVKDPPFLGKQLTAVGMFQNRLLVCSADGGVAVSAVGDYLAFYPSSVTAALEDDPVVLSANEAVRDTVNSVVSFDRHLLLLGRRQYLLRGDTKLGATQLTVVSEYPGMTMATKVGTDTYVYSASGTPHVVQVQTGQYADSTEMFNISPQLVAALEGALQLVPAVACAGVAVRVPAGVWVLKVLDTGGGRKQASWFKFTYRQAYGELLGVVALDAGLGLVFKDADGVWLDYQPFDKASPLEPDGMSTPSSVVVPAFITRSQTGPVLYGDTTIQYVQVLAEFSALQITGAGATRIYDTHYVTSPLDTPTIEQDEIRYPLGVRAVDSSITVTSADDLQVTLHAVGFVGQRFARGARL